MRQRRMPAMAYCPIDGGALSRSPALADIAQRLGVTAAQVALAWVLAAALHPGHSESLCAPNTCARTGRPWT